MSRINGKYARVGTIAKIEDTGRLPNGSEVVVIRGLNRGIIGAGVPGIGSALRVQVEAVSDDNPSTRATELAREYKAIVENLLEQNGYRRRGNERRESSLLEVVFHELDSAWSMEIIKGLENVARENDMSVVLTESGNRHAPGPEWISGVLRRRPVGVVLNAVASPSLQERFMKLGSEPTGSTPAEFMKLVQEDTVRLTRIAKAAGIKAD